MATTVVNGASFPQRVTGVQRYARELAQRLLGDPAVRLVLPEAVPDFRPPPGARVDVVPSPRWAARAGAWGWLETGLRRALEPEELLWSPTIRAPVSVRRHVITVHDLSPLDHPEWFRRRVVAQWRTLVPAQRRTAAHVVTDSEFSRRRLLAMFGMREADVTVVPCGVDARFAEVDDDAVAAVRDRLRLPERFVLSVGSRDPRKNVDLLLRAWSTAGVPTDTSLVLAGGSARTFADAGSVDLPAGVRHLGYVDDADLPGLYAAADAFVFPSLYEGFGMPPLESMAAGTPVVALASTEAVVEVVGDAGVLVAGDPTSLGDALRDLLADPVARAELAAAGRTRAAEFTWERSADLLRDVLAGCR